MTEKYKARLELLRELSNEVKPLVKNGDYENINQAIVETVYKPQGHTQLKTIRQWNEEGKRVVKGETALIIWGSPKQPKNRKQPAEPAEESELIDLEFFPLCYVFSEKQVK